MKYLIVTLLLCLSAAAQSAPHPMLSPFKDPYFYGGTLFHTSSVLADVAHSKRCQLERTCLEANPGADSYGRRSIEIVGVGAMNYGCSLMLADHHRWRAACLLVPVAVGIFHWRDATRIYRTR